jgi:type I restriction enzyme S subunit
MIRLRLVAAPSLNQLVGLIWQSRFVRRQVEKRARTTAGIYKILQRDIDSFVIPLPPSDEQIEILEAVSKQLCFIRRVEAIVEANLARAARLRQGILKRAFEGRLVPQDPTDEPAEQLLERIRQERTFTATNLSKNKTRSKHTTGQRSGRLFTKDTEPG